jgi:excisionase family DNA binding protein
VDKIPSNHKLTTSRTAIILPIRTESDRGPISTPPNGGDANGDSVAKNPRRLTFTVDEAAYLLNISRGLAYELVARGELESIRLGRRIVIPRMVLEGLTGTAID